MTSSPSYPAKPKLLRIFALRVGISLALLELAMDCTHQNLNKIARAIYAVTASKVVELMSWEGEYQHKAATFDELSELERELHLEYAVAAVQALQDVFGT